MDKSDVTILLGNTTLHFYTVEPSVEEKQKILAQVQVINWDCWNALTLAQQKQMNKKYE